MPMFDRSKVAPDDPMFEHIDVIKQTIVRMRGRLFEKVKVTGDERLELFGNIECFFQAHLRRAYLKRAT